MASTLEEIYDRQKTIALKNKVEAALLKKAATDIVAASPENAVYAATIFSAGGDTEALRALRYLVGKYPDVTAPTDAQIETAVGEVYPKL